MSRIEVCGFANAILDVLVKIDDDLFNALGLEKGTMRLVDEAEQKSLLAACSKFPSQKVSGGSVANSIIACAQLGAKAGLIGRMGDDENGRFYKAECESLGIKMPNALSPGETTGTCLSIITPDAERTMRTSLGAAKALGEDNLPLDVIFSSDWLFIEGYVISNGLKVREVLRKLLAEAKTKHLKIAFTVSESWVVNSFRDIVEDIVSQSDLVFCNASEACALTGETSEESAFELLSSKLPGVAVTAGEKGAFVSWKGVKGFVEAFQREAVDLTGAGDMFAGALIYGILRNVPILEAARKACFLAGEVISGVGARLQTDIKVLWEQCS
ncbi:MAG: adenosine kinase [SAR324 cluster bacterium]|uniref:Adenosine kinase n=1 Tax=SAR324 cluster bacterium TaxID=2024889 RepID=A0A7X9FU13_9DELT|nr:adenosine kinase [SAR324 cluster bacterium]